MMILGESCSVRLPVMRHEETHCLFPLLSQFGDSKHVWPLSLGLIAAANQYHQRRVIYDCDVQDVVVSVHW